MAAATVNAFAMIGSIAGGYYCFLIILGLLIAAVGLVPALLLRRFPILAWIVGLGVTALVSYLLAVSAVYASYDATFLRVFYVTPPTGIRFVSAQRSLALSDGAAIVVIDGVSRAELDPLLASGGLTRDQAREERIAASATPAQDLALVASGTRFLEEVRPSTTMEVYRSDRGWQGWVFVIYFPEAERAYAFYLEI